MARVWVYSTRPRSCGKCSRTILPAEIALQLQLQSAPHVKVWRCQVCVGPPPAEVVASAEAIAVDEAAQSKRSLMERLEAIGRRLARRPVDVKARQSGDEAP